MYYGRGLSSKTCDDNELREDKEDICEEAKTRGKGQVGQREKREEWDGDNE